jgi:hypothetical protein
MKQTAVEWLQLQIDNKDMGEIPMWVYEFIEQAKEMEKEQKIAFGKKCYHPLTERKYTSDVHFECTICGDNNY